MAGVEGQRFPFVNLEKAVERAKQIYTGDARGNEMSVPTAFTCWGYSEKSSGGFQTISALKSYGLLIDIGANESRKVKLTKEALNYFRDEREDVRQELLKSFAFPSPLLKALWSLWGAEPPSDTVARSQLKVDRHLNEQSARTVLGIYKDNLSFAKLTGDDTIAELGDGVDRSKSETKVRLGDYVRWSGAGFDEGDQPRRVTWVSDDQKFIRVHGSATGIPMVEVTLTEAPKLDAVRRSFDPLRKADRLDGDDGKSDMSVLLTGNRLQITADVDAAGIAKLKEVLAKYEEILTLLQ